jgi:hypothetical protein
MGSAQIVLLTGDEPMSRWAKAIIDMPENPNADWESVFRFVEYPYRSASAGPALAAFNSLHRPDGSDAKRESGERCA